MPRQYVYIDALLGAVAPSDHDVALVNNLNLFPVFGTPVVGFGDLVVPNEGVINVPSNVILLEILTRDAWFFSDFSNVHTVETLGLIERKTLLEVDHIASVKVFSYSAARVIVKGYYALT